MFKNISGTSVTLVVIAFITFIAVWPLRKTSANTQTQETHYSSLHNTDQLVKNPLPVNEKSRDIVHLRDVNTFEVVFCKKSQIAAACNTPVEYHNKEITLNDITIYEGNLPENAKPEVDNPSRTYSASKRRMYVLPSEVVQPLDSSAEVAIVVDRGTYVRIDKADFNCYMGTAISRRYYEQCKKSGSLDEIKYQFKRLNWNNFSYLL
jgi:hypothetical protein